MTPFRKCIPFNFGNHKKYIDQICLKKNTLKGNAIFSVTHNFSRSVYTPTPLMCHSLLITLQLLSIHLKSNLSVISCGLPTIGMLYKTFFIHLKSNLGVISCGLPMIGMLYKTFYTFSFGFLNYTFP